MKIVNVSNETLKSFEGKIRVAVKNNRMETLAAWETDVCVDELSSKDTVLPAELSALIDERPTERFLEYVLEREGKIVERDGKIYVKPCEYCFEDPTLKASVREENGAFKSRAEILKVPRIGAKAYEQCAGFLRIHGAADPLDNSAVHPEAYHIVDKMAADLGVAVKELVDEGILAIADGGYLLASDVSLLEKYEPVEMHFVYAIHRNDVLYKSQEPILKEKAKEWTEGLTYDHEPLQYLLIDGEFRGASVGHFRNGPYDLNDIVCDLPKAQKRKDEIVEAICQVNYGKMPERFMGEAI